MIRHVVLLTWTPDATPEQHQAVVDTLRGLPAVIPQIVRYRVGTDLGLAEGNVDLVVIADFASAEDYVVYRDHADHQAAIATRIKPILAGRTAIQYEYDDDAAAD